MSIDFVENYENLSDEELIFLIKNGDFELFQLMISRYLPLIHYFVNGYCAENEREDAVQEATYALFSAVKAFNPDKSSFKTFATLCIKRSVLSAVNRLLSAKKIPDELLSPIEELEIPDLSSPEKIVIDKESFDTLRRNIKLELSELEYSVLELFLSGKSYLEIAEKLDINEKSVNNALLRIRKKLRS